MKQGELFKKKLVPAKPGSGKLFEEEIVVNDGPVVCLGQEFESDVARREYFAALLREKLNDPEFRKIEGFPIGEDEDILALSDPPYYTACPNPWIGDFIKEWESQKPEKPKNYQYHREPFAVDVSEGKNDPFYRAHSYHTKVPPKAIVTYLLHYTDVGDIVFDGFSGSGMSGLAAYLCENLNSQDKEQIRNIFHGASYNEPSFGPRHSIIGDLGPAAVSIGYSYNRKVNSIEYNKQAKSLIKELRNEFGHFYETLHSDNQSTGIINYTVLSDIFICQSCGAELCYWDIAVDKEKNEHKEIFECTSCKSSLKRSDLDRAYTSYYDNIAGEVVKCVKRKPVLINYYIGKKKYEKIPDSKDIEKSENIDLKRVLQYLPVNKIPYMHMTHERNNLASQGITYIHHFYSARNLFIAAEMWQRIINKYTLLINIFTAINPRLITQMSAYRVGKGKSNLRTGTLYIPSLTSDYNVIGAFESKYKVLSKILLSSEKSKPHTISTTQSHIDLSNIPSNSIDYIFTDPPFGENIYYSDLNYIWESWLGVITNSDSEAIVDKAKKKGNVEYKYLISMSFKEAFRILKKGRWITVEFHNSQNAIWTCIQNALIENGFVIADVRILDKKQGSIKQVIESSAIKQDLIISAYKPVEALNEKINLYTSSEQSAWDFVREHLKMLPVFVSNLGIAEVVIERQGFLLYDRMVAIHVQNNMTVPCSAAEFNLGLKTRFSERDGMYFLSEQVTEYDKKRLQSKGIRQLSLFVTNEASAIQWLYHKLKDKPQTFSDIHPQFMKEISGWSKNEKILELSILLEQNFLCYDGKGRVPEQIHAYLSTNWKELRNLRKEDPSLVAKAKDRWYVPDPSKAGDLEKLREKSLLKEFEEYKASKKKLKLFRLEAVRTGFKKCWQERDYATIISVAEKIPNNVLEEDPKLLMWYDQAVTRSQG
ncbi:DNA methylase [Candidatus Scalindua japonica]|nr:DNA methylase [Candidatus Scalindua japonica]